VIGKVLIFRLQILGCNEDGYGEISMVMGMEMGNFWWGWGISFGNGMRKI